MLLITAKQLEQLDAIRLAGFHRVCVRALRERHEEDAAAFDGAALLALVKKVDGRATGEFALDVEEHRFKLMALALKHPLLSAESVPDDIVDLMTWPDRPVERKFTMLEKRLGAGAPKGGE
jgi:hypothetical protein